jgi:type II secretory pathway pseudopilin PulG
MAKHPTGLGFLEVIIALSVMVVGIASGLTLTTYNLANVVVASNQSVATNLAREPIEIIRAWRDSQWLSKQSWLDIFDANEKQAVFNVFNGINNQWQLFWSNDADINNCQRCQVLYSPEKKLFLQNADMNGSPLTIGVQDTGYRRLTRVQDICWSSISKTQVLKDFGVTCSVDESIIGWRLTTIVSWYNNQNKKTLSLIDELYDWR